MYFCDVLWKVKELLKLISKCLLQDRVGLHWKLVLEVDPVWMFWSWVQNQANHERNLIVTLLFATFWAFSCNQAHGSTVFCIISLCILLFSELNWQMSALCWKSISLFPITGPESPWAILMVKSVLDFSLVQSYFASYCISYFNGLEFWSAIYNTLHVHEYKILQWRYPHSHWLSMPGMLYFLLAVGMFTMTLQIFKNNL